MPSTSTLVRSRRTRRLNDQRLRTTGLKRTGLGVGIIISILITVLILLGALAYADLTRDLPNVALLPALLNPPDGLLLQPTRLYDRTGQHVLYTFSPEKAGALPASASPNSPSELGAGGANEVGLGLRRYIPLSAAAPQHLPDFLARATVVLTDPGFWTHGGWRLSGLNDPGSHPTIAQKLVSDLLLYGEPPSLRRALRERILAAQLISQYGRSQVLEWYLNSADYGNYAYGVDAAAQLYFNKSATDLTASESAVLAATSQAPGLNPLDASDLALQRGRTAIDLMRTFKLITPAEADAALAEKLSVVSLGSAISNQQSAIQNSLFPSLVLNQLASSFTRDRITRGGLNIITTLDYDLQQASSAAVLASAAEAPAVSVQGGLSTGGNAAAVGGLSIGPTPAPGAPDYGSGGVVSLSPGSTAPPNTSLTFPQSANGGPSTASLILDPQSGQILAATGETLRGRETPNLSPHDPGSLLTPFIYLTAFTRGFSPGSLVWDIGRTSVEGASPTSAPGGAEAPLLGQGGAGPGGEGQSSISNPQSASFHGPVRMRIALVNDYLAAAQSIAAQMGADAISRTESSFGLSSPSAPLSLGEGGAAASGEGTRGTTLLDLASAYAVFAANGVRYGLPGPSAVLRVEGVDHSVWLDNSNPQAQPVVSQPLAYLINNVLSDEAARWPSLGHPNELEIGRPVGVKLGQSAADSWAIGYTPSRLVAIWQDARAASPITGGAASASQSEIVNRKSKISSLLSSLLQLSTASVPADGWAAPPGISTVDVCDPSGQLPTKDCPSTVTEVFLTGNEPVQPDTLFHTYTVNRETGLLATVFTPPQLVEDKVFMVVPPEAQDWAKSAGIPVAPSSFDAIQAPPVDPDVHFSSPAMFSDVTGKVQLRGTASGASFDHYRILAGQGLNPQSWIVVIPDTSTRIEEGLLGTWDTSGLSGLYAVELQVIRTDQQIDTAILQVTVK